MNTAATYPEQASTLGALLRSPYRRLSDLLYLEMADSGHPEIRPAHSAVFRHILPTGSRLTELAAAAGMTKQSMAYLVEHLEANGYLKIRPDPADSRAKQVKLSARGTAFIHDLLAASARIESVIAKKIGKARLKDLREGLQLLDEALKAP